MTGQLSVRRLDDMPVDPGVVPGVQVRRLEEVENAALKVMDVAPGRATSLHTHAHAHTAVIVAGTGALRGDDGTHPLTPGDTFRVGPDEPHAIENHGSELLRLICLDCSIR